MDDNDNRLFGQRPRSCGSQARLSVNTENAALFRPSLSKQPMAKERCRFIAREAVQRGPWYLASSTRLLLAPSLKFLDETGDRSVRWLQLLELLRVVEGADWIA